MLKLAMLAGCCAAILGFSGCCGCPVVSGGCGGGPSCSYGRYGRSCEHSWDADFGLFSHDGALHDGGCTSCGEPYRRKCACGLEAFFWDLFGWGCGKTYYGEYKNDPPDWHDPCDNCGNFTGGHGPYRSPYRSGPMDYIESTGEGPVSLDEMEIGEEYYVPGSYQVSDVAAEPKPKSKPQRLARRSGSQVKPTSSTSEMKPVSRRNTWRARTTPPRR